MRFNLLYKKKFFIIFIFYTIFYTNPLSAEKDLSSLAIECQTDKIWAHNYIPTYEFYFKALRNQPIKLLEIGFLSGCSAKMWDRYFQNGTLHFIDIQPESFEKYSGGLSSKCHFYIADQAKEADLIEFIKKSGGDFDIILDDGGHTMEQQITSFKTLFPFLKSGGMYIIEDLHTSYWTSFGGSGEVGSPKANDSSTIRFLQNLVDDVNFIGATTGYADRRKCPENIMRTLTYYQQHIKSIHFYCSLCFIFKN